jgi:pimeloyl-ACP methyl ester carboxylesterase
MGPCLMGDGFEDRFISAADGLRLYARDYGRASGKALPVVCLPGLARTAEDFHEIALALSHNARPRRVLCLDFRGRGRSEWDKDSRNYDVRVELADVLQVVTAAEIEKALFIGTSRGGLITMALSAMRPALLRGAVLNDIGPVIGGKGLVRIRGYVGKLPLPRSHAEGAQLLKSISDAQFPRLTDEQWLRMARNTWREDNGRLALTYDPNLMKSLASIDLETPLPTLWPLFEGLKRIPVLVLRGQHSDILDAGTVDRMRLAHPHLEVVTVPDQGHAPILEGDVAAKVRSFITKADGERRTA